MFVLITFLSKNSDYRGLGRAPLYNKKIELK
jgi:hypothetical protein